MTAADVGICQRCGRTFGHDGQAPWPNWVCHKPDLEGDCAYLAAVSARRSKAGAEAEVLR